MLKTSIDKILNEIANGNNLGEKITLVAATKTVPYEIINEAIEDGIEVVAENRVQEFREKTEFIVGAKQHFIGHLQTNKVKYIIGKVDLIQSVDSLHLAEEISKQAATKNIIQNILAEINIGGELSKSGFNPENAVQSIKTLSELSNINVSGLMAMLPKTDDKKLLQNLCLSVRKIYDNLKEQGYAMKYLSLGMSGDYGIAIKNGSNMIRIGSAIFGKRV